MPSTLALASGLYTLTMPQGIKYTFNSEGRISTLTYPAGVTLTYSYSGGLLSTITNGLGRTLTLNYTGSQLTSVTDGSGRSVSYIFDGDGNLSTFTDADSNAITYQYDQPGRLTEYFLAANRQRRLSRTSTIRLVSQTQGLTFGAKYQPATSQELVRRLLIRSAIRPLDFNQFGLTTRLIDADGNETGMAYDGWFDPHR